MKQVIGEFDYNTYKYTDPIYALLSSYHLAILAHNEHKVYDRISRTVELTLNEVRKDIREHVNEQTLRKNQ